MNLITQLSGSFSEGEKPIPLSLTIRPACGVPGDYRYVTNTAALMRMLHKNTDLSFDILSRFEGEMCSYPSARLLGVEMSESLLTEIGYFIE